MNRSPLVPKFKPKIKLQLKDEIPITAFSFMKRDQEKNDGGKN